MNLKVVKTLIDQDFILYLKGLNYFFSKGIEWEISRISEPLPGIDLSQYKKFDILTDDSDPYLCYLINSIYSWLDDKQKTYFFLFLADLIIANQKRVTLTSKRKTETFIQLIEHYSDFLEDPQLSLEEDELVILIFLVYMSNKRLLDKDKSLINLIMNKK